MTFDLGKLAKRLFNSIDACKHGNRLVMCEPCKQLIIQSLDDAAVKAHIHGDPCKECVRIIEDEIQDYEYIGIRIPHD